MNISDRFFISAWGCAIFACQFFLAAPTMRNGILQGVFTALCFLSICCWGATMPRDYDHEEEWKQ